MDKVSHTTEKLLQRNLDVLLRTGKMLVESTADTSRVLRNMKRTAAFLGLPEEHLHIFVTYNMLMVSLSDGQHSFSKYQRCENHHVDMMVITAISTLTWRAVEEDYTLEKFESELSRIQHLQSNYPLWMVTLFIGLACGGFCIQFGGDWKAFFYTSLAAAAGFFVRNRLNKAGTNHYINIAIASLTATLIAWISTFVSADGLSGLLPAWLSGLLQSHTPWHPLMACALFIIPGVPIINFVTDMLDSHIQVGVVRAVNTMLIVTSMSFGIVFAIKVCGINNFVTDLSMIPHGANYLEFALSAGIAAMGFSMIFNIPHRLLWVVTLGGVIAVCIRNFVSLGYSSSNIGLDMGPVIGSLAGASLIGIIATKAIDKFNTPHYCLAIPSVIPMIPGVLMYRALFAFINMDGSSGEISVAMTNSIRASLIVLCIALGIALPNLFGRYWITSKHIRMFNALIEKRKQKGRFMDLDEID